MTFARIFSAAFFFFVPLLLAGPVVAATPQIPTEPDKYELSLSFIPGEQSGKLTGTAKITIMPGSRLTLAFPQMEITGTLLRDSNGRENELLPIQDILILPASPVKRTLYISYTRTVEREADNLISPAGISLASNWYPIPDQPMRYRLTALLPDNFLAITEADAFPLTRRGNTVSSLFTQPVRGIHFAAGPYTIHKRQVRENLFVYSMFFPEDMELAEGYLQAAVEYLNRYERQIGPYPYNHYVIVANRLPTGFGMPTFTLLGQTVLRLPFIKDTSLGHEIVHSWFGNAVEVDYTTGNWCEGLTAFLADHAFREEKGEGIADRKESIVKYLSYVNEETVIPLAEFTSASHSQPMAEAKRAVGYNRGALFFHELREKIGRSAFQEGLRKFYTDNNGRTAGWDDLRQSFAAAAKTDLDRFFEERLERKDIPSVAVKDIAITTQNNHPLLTFTLLQQTEEPYSLVVPLHIRSMAGDKILKLKVDQLSTPVAIPLEQHPLAFTLDPRHDFLRQLAPEELPAVWSRFMGSDKKLIILAGENYRDLYRPLLETIGEENTVIITAEKVTDKTLAENDLLFLGSDQPPARALFGPPPADGSGFILDVRRNPLNPDNVAVRVTSDDPTDILAVAGRLSHYGKYSFLQFNKGRHTDKRIQPVQSGLHFVLEDLPQGGAATDLSSFDRIVDKLAEARVIYIGETHTSSADHLLQLRIIEALYRKNPQLAIGMEMFPAAAQPVLDRYTLGHEQLDERIFLKESDYFNVWRYDYRYYRDILNFAKNFRLPVVGLNLDRQIVSEVFRAGGTDSLSPEIRASLPQDRDLDLEGYIDRLSEIHTVHIEGNHGSGAASGFIQAQALWDETMAQNIARFLAENPGYQMVVLAGTQHTRKDSGIPPRVARRLPVGQFSVVNLSSERSPLDLQRISDYYFFASSPDLPVNPKIGLILDTETKDGHSFLKIDQISPHGKAGAAGLLKGDILKEAGGVALANMADLQIAMLDAKPGDILSVKVIRKIHDEERILDFQVELTAPPPSLPHP
ncbi:MAG: hypothetical protein VR65_20510 [Desulfobulbaceae bacterium BRH_c16a]|nr:MAG: hypothetical protein VR65_20510 [Desulfobulbaceae bacterium BRH_c16a]